MDAGRRPALLPVREPRVLLLDRVEPCGPSAPWPGCAGWRFHGALAIRVADPAHVGDDAVVREHRRVHRVQLRLVEVRRDHALLKLSRTTYWQQPPKARQASSCSCAQTSWLVFHTILRKLLPEYLSVITNRYGRRYLPGAERQRALAVVDLRLLARRELQHVEALGLARAAGDEALHRVVAVPETLAPRPSPGRCSPRFAQAAPAPRSTPGAARTPKCCPPPVLDRRAGRSSSRWPGWGNLSRPGACREPVATPGEFASPRVSPDGLADPRPSDARSLAAGAAPEQRVDGHAQMWLQDVHSCSLSAVRSNQRNVPPSRTSD